MCAPVIRQQRAQEVDQGVTAHLEAGGGAEFLTVTVPHYQADALAPRLAVIRKALGLILSGAPWKRRKAALGYLGAIRAVEITYGWNGWHPHLHCILIFERPLTDEERADLRQWMSGRWAGVVAAKGWGQLHGVHGLDLRPVTSEGLGEYLTKVEGGWTPGAELVRSDLKSGGKGWTPFRLLYELATTGEVRWLRLWQEYEEATFGAHSLEWSPGLKARLLGKAPEKSDAELAAAVEGSGLAIVRALIEAGAWRNEVKAGTVGLLLDRIEDQAAIVMALVRMAGHELLPLEATEGGGKHEQRKTIPAALVT